EGDDNIGAYFVPDRTWMKGDELKLDWKVSFISGDPQENGGAKAVGFDREHAAGGSTYRVKFSGGFLDAVNDAGKLKAEIRVDGSVLDNASLNVADGVFTAEFFVGQG